MPPDGPSSTSLTPDTFNAYQVSVQEAAVRATKCSIRLPQDLSFHRSLDRKFGKRLDACSARVLRLTEKLLDYASAEDANTKRKGKRKLESEEDVVDGFHFHVVDIMDQLLERTDTCLDEFLGRIKPAAIAVNPQAQSPAKVAKITHGRLDPALAHASHLPKPQLLFRTPVDNTGTPWWPKLRTKPHALVPLSQSLTEGIIHPYHHEIAHFTPPEHLLTPLALPAPPEPLTTAQPATYISHTEQLPALLAALKDANAIAVDLEHHSYRSFSGFVCLMQLSTRTHDWIVDCLEPGLREELECLNEVFADPRIVKVLHGAESDIVWLQQNFNLYIVNLFDTYHATKVLKFPKHSLASLLETYCDFTPDKRFQLADWRIRPLPEEMLLYARADTHFLLFIYDNLLHALDPVATAEVYRRSSETALRTYKQVHDTEEWETLGKKWNRNLAGVSGAVFRAVYGWRERVARSEDESTRYVLANHYLFRLAEQPPADLASLSSTFRAVPPLVRTRSDELLAIIREAIQSAVSEGEYPTDAGKIQDVSASTESPLDKYPNVGHNAHIIWDNLMPTAATDTLPHRATTSTLIGIPSLDTLQLPYATSASTLFGALTAVRKASDERYHVLATRIHASLAPAPSHTITISQPEISRAASPTVIQPQETIATVPVHTQDPTVQAEIPFVPREQRHTDQIAGEEEGIVVVGRQKKRKRHNTSASGSATPKKHRSASATPVPDFDYSKAPNILDEPAPVATPTLRKKKERGKGGGKKRGEFGLPPRNMSELKSGNQSRTF